MQHPVEKHILHTLNYDKKSKYGNQKYYNDFFPSKVSLLQALPATKLDFFSTVLNIDLAMKIVKNIKMFEFFLSAR